jgi:uncharacterized protein YqhQ
MSEKKIQVGGQAVIEGVMMRGPSHIATAIRRKNGTIDVQVKPFVTLTKSHMLYSRPIIRGFVSLIEMLKIGISALNFSANRYELDYQDDAKSDDESQVSENKKKKPSLARQKFEEALTICIAFVLAFALFGYVPYLCAQLLNLSKSDVLFNLFAGCIRIIFFVLYVYLISLMKDIRRVFEYHGAEHKAVTAHEHKETLTIENVRKYTTIHPRCGTSFMFFVLLVAILVFSVLDTFVSIYIAPPTAIVRLLYHLPFLPLIAGISYEFLRLTEKNINHPLVKVFTIPGMSLQKITTQPPDDIQIETAIVALKAALGDDISGYTCSIDGTSPSPDISSPDENLE